MTDIDLTEREIANIIDSTKIVASELIWVESPTNSVFSDSKSFLEDADGVVLPGLRLEMSFRQGVVVDRCKYSFSIWKIRAGVRHLVMRMDIGPWDKRTHNGPPALYGPHLHIGSAVLPIAQNGLTCKDYGDWLESFCQIAGIKIDKPFKNPYEFSLEMS